MAIQFLPLLKAAAPIIGAGIGAAGSFFGNRAQANASRDAANRQAQSTEAQLDFQRQAGAYGMEGSILENRRRQQEAAYRAANLEDVANMFRGMEGPQFGTVSADTVSAQQIGELQETQEMRDLAGALARQDDSLDLRRAAMREAEQGMEGLNAQMAAMGVRGSGFGASQAQGMQADMLSGLAQQISNQRMQATQAAGQLFGQAGQMNLGRQQANQQSALQAATANQAAQLQAAGINQRAAQAAADFNLMRGQNISQLMQDEAFGANAPLDQSREYELLRRMQAEAGMEQTPMPEQYQTQGGFGGLRNALVNTAPTMYAGGSPDFNEAGPMIGDTMNQMFGRPGGRI